MSLLSSEIVYDFYQESDAGLVADLLNRTRFHTARHQYMTAENYLFTQRMRGVHFQVVAKKKGKIIGSLAAYPTSDSHVAGKHQLYVGSLLVDLQHRLSHSVIMGLYECFIKGLAGMDVRELLASVRPENESSYHLMLKAGFILLDETQNEFGRMGLNSFLPALARYVGSEGTEVSDNAFFANLPIVDKKEARKMQGKPRIHEKYIECEYKLNGKNVILLFDIANKKVDGGIIPGHIKFYPKFDTAGAYVMENLSQQTPYTAKIEFVMEEQSGLENVTEEFTLEPGESRVFECSKDVSELKLVYEDILYIFYPNLFDEVIVPKEPIKLECGKLSVMLEPSTGFLSVMNGETKLATLVWPCAVFPYLEGVNTPRYKDLLVEQVDNGLVVTEETDDYKITRKFMLSENKMNVTTILKCDKEGLNVRPISQIFARKGVNGYSVTSGEKIIDYGPSEIKHQGFQYSDYPYWDTEPERFADFPIECISLKYPSNTVDFVIEPKGKMVVHAPLFTSTLDVDMNKILEEQVIEQMEVFYRTEEM